MILDLISGSLLLVTIVLLTLVLKRLVSIEKSQTEFNRQNNLNSLHEEISKSEQEIKGEVKSNQQIIANTLTQQLQSTTQTLVSTLGTLGEAQTRELESVTTSTNTLTQSNETRIENVRQTVNDRLQALQDNNEKKLDEIRQTVNEQLQSTLEKRLTESFNIVSERLEAVQRGLGTMQNLAAGVGDLQRVLTNVSTRGAWGEVQLGSILEEILTPDQYSTNVKPHEGSERVEYAIRLPGDNEDPKSCVWLPIDSKFPIADYQRLVDAAEIADKDAEQKAIKALMGTVQKEAKKIHDKYIIPPHTTEFAIMFLPTEGLYSEVLRQPGQVEKLLQEHRIVVAGPTNLASILISLRVGFRTLAIQKHSTEIWKILAAVKTEFDKFATIMEKLQRQLNTASRTVESTGARTRAMARHLENVEELPQNEASETLGLPDIELNKNLK